MKRSSDAFIELDKAFKRGNYNHETMGYGRKRYGRKQFSRRKYTPKRRNYKRRAATNKVVRKLVRHDKERRCKYIVWTDTSVTGAAPWSPSLNGTYLNNANPFLTYLTQVKQFLTSVGRIGDWLYVSKIAASIKFTFGTSVSGDVCLRYMLVVDREMNGSATSASAFGTNYFGTSDPSPVHMRQLLNRDTSKYKILKQGTVMMRELVASNTQERYVHINWFGKEPIKVSMTRGDAGDTTDIDKNGVFLYFYTDYTGAQASTGINAIMEGRVYFHDQA